MEESDVKLMKGPAEDAEQDFCLITMYSVHRIDTET